MTEPVFDVCAMGGALVDVLASCTDDHLARHNITKGAMTLIDDTQAESLYNAMGTATESSGGSAANTAAAIASLGGRVAFLGRVRDDQLGHIFIHDMRALGITFDCAPATSGPATGRCLVHVTPDGQRSMCTFLGASATFGPPDIHADSVTRASFLYVEGYLFDPPAAKDAIFQAVRMARAAGRKVAITLSDSFCVTRHFDDFHRLIKECDVLFANQHELEALYQTNDLNSAIDQVRADVPLAAVTMSADGAVLVRGPDSVRIHAEPTTVVDTTGAGDMFAAGVLFGLARHQSLPECGRLGAILAADVIAHMGARSPHPLNDVVAKALGYHRV